MTSSYRWVATCLSAVLLVGCVAAPRVSPAPPTSAPFPVAAFFTGESHGDGTLRVITRSPVRVEVDSVGTAAPDGTLTLVQRVRESDKAERTRSWTLREVAPGRWSGTLTDADGPVSATATPGTLDIAFPMNGMQVRQHLVLSANGQSARNILRVSKFGVTVAVLDETITRGPRARH